MKKNTASNNNHHPSTNNPNIASGSVKKLKGDYSIFFASCTSLNPPSLAPSHPAYMTKARLPDKKGFTKGQEIEFELPIDKYLLKELDNSMPIIAKLLPKKPTRKDLLDLLAKNVNPDLPLTFKNDSIYCLNITHQKIKYRVVCARSKPPHDHTFMVLKCCSEATQILKLEYTSYLDLLEFQYAYTHSPDSYMSLLKK